MWCWKEIFERDVSAPSVRRPHAPPPPAGVLRPPAGFGKSPAAQGPQDARGQPIFRRARKHVPPPHVVREVAQRTPKT